jgi:hypothetical protein
MTIDEARRAVNDLCKEMVATEKRLTTLRRLLAGYLELFPDLVAKDPDLSGESARPKGQEAVLRVLMDSPRTWFTVAGVVKELAQRGWSPSSDDPENPVRTSLTRVEAGNPDIRKGQDKDSGAVAYGYWPQVGADGKRRLVDVGARAARQTGSRTLSEEPPF